MQYAFLNSVTTMCFPVIATRYRLVYEPLWGRNFSEPSRLTSRPTMPAVQRIPGHFRWGKAVGACAHHPSTSSVGVEYGLSYNLLPSVL